jgi:hypothetical protein
LNPHFDQDPPFNQAHLPEMEKLGVDMAHDWNKASKQESFCEQEKSFAFGKTSSQYGT